MPLINKRLQQAHLKINPIPAKHLSLLKNWQQSIQEQSIYSQKETALHSHFIQKILIDILGYQGFNGKHWTLAQEQKIGSGSVDVALGHFDPQQSQTLAPFELKGAKTKNLDAIMPGRHKSPVQQAWEYGMDASGAQWVLVSNYLEIRLYAIGYGRQDYERWDLAQLTDPTEYARLQWLLSAEQLLSGNTKKILQASDQLDKEITDQLYQDYKNLRENLIKHLQQSNPEISALDIIRLSQKILDRILFIAFAEDRGLLPSRSIAQAYQNQDLYKPHPIWENFKGLFKFIDKGKQSLNIPAYNGGLFANDPELNRLKVNDDICKAFKNLAEYDFASEVSVTVLGHIFEQSISDIEQLQAAARGDTHIDSKRKQHGVVYTPDHITRFIVEKTLGTHLNSAFDTLWQQHQNGRYQRGERKEQWKNNKAETAFWRDYQKQIRSTRVLDPACGSGAFLVAAFDYLQAEYNRVNDMLSQLTGSFGLFDLNKEILNRNLYGVDLNAESIEITKLSLWLKTAEHGKALNSLKANLHSANSLINDPNYTDKPFDWSKFDADIQASQADLFKGKHRSGFDVILGNPPYVRQEIFSADKPYLRQNYTVYHGVADLYTYFFELGINLLKTGGRMGYISSSTFFKTSSGKNLRSYLMEHSRLENIIDFSDLQVFAGVTTYPAIICLQKQSPDTEHRIQNLILNDKIPENLNKYYDKHAFSMKQIYLEKNAWCFETEEIIKLRHKVTADKPSLKQVYGSPLYGIKTGLNAAFVIDRATRDKLIQTDPKSIELLKPFLEGKDLKKWRAEPQGLSLILIPKGWTRTQKNAETEQIAWEWLSKTYPAIAKHLSRFEIKAKKRTDKGDFWWELRTCAYYAEFEKPKIIYAHFQANPLFSFEKKGVFCNNKAYISAKMGFYELGLLNSSIIWFVFTCLTTMMRGGFFEATSQNINKLPIPSASESEKQHIAKLAETCQQSAEQRYQKQSAVRRRIPDLCPAERTAKLTTKLKNWWLLDFASFRKEIKKAFKQDIPLQDRNDWENWLNSEAAKIQELDQQITSLETQINQAVYKLFALSPADIALLEAQI